MLHEVVELVKALAWPCVVIFILLRFRRQISQLLDELPFAVRRMRSAHGLGVEIEMERLDTELPLAGQEARQIALKLPTPPELKSNNEGH
jgi:hypothetical protein